MKLKNSTVRVNKLLVGCIVLLFCLVIVKIAYVNLSEKVDGMDLAAFRDSRNIENKTLYANRGNIYDSNGEVLAQIVNSYKIILFLSESRTTNTSNPKHVVDKNLTAEKLAEVLDMDAGYILERIESGQSGNKYQVELGTKGRDLSEYKKKQIEALNLPGIGFEASTSRYYPMGSFAPYIIGYARKEDTDEIVGSMGVEKYYNEYLKGTDGYTRYEKDLYGYQIPNTNPVTVEAEDGNDIYLTLDNDIQLLIKDTISKLADANTMDWLHITVADAKTGAILGHDSTPTFDLNSLSNIEDYNNPLVSYQYEPGSTMKVFSWMAAIENGLYDGEKKFKSGSVQIGEHTISDFNDAGWGVMTMDQGFAYSANTAAYEIGKSLGRDKLKDFYRKLGFGDVSGITLPNEASGAINFNYEIEVITAAFGQGITTTPIQTIQALTSLTNNGTVLKPYIIDKIVDAEGNVIEQGKREELETVASKETVDKMLKLLEDVVYSDVATAAKYYRPANVKLIGKTGTAEIASANGGYLNGRYDYINSFAGIFPGDDPKYIIYFSAKGFQGVGRELSRSIASLVDAIAKKDTTIDDTTTIDETKLCKLENFKNQETTVAKEKLETMALKPIILGDGSIVVDQYPKRNTVIPVDNKVFLLTNNKNYLMPNAIGWSENEIITFCNMIGVKYKIEGYGKVTGTNIPEGTQIDFTQVLNIVLEDS